MVRRLIVRLIFGRRVERLLDEDVVEILENVHKFKNALRDWSLTNIGRDIFRKAK